MEPVGKTGNGLPRRLPEILAAYVKVVAILTGIPQEDKAYMALAGMMAALCWMCGEDVGIVSSYLDVEPVPMEVK